MNAYSTTVSGKRWLRTFAFCIGNHMISSAIWDKSARVNFSKTYQIVVQFVVFEKFTSADLSQIAREKSCDCLLIIHIQKFYTASSCKWMSN